MVIKASKINNIDDFIDCVLFGLKYLSLDDNDINKNKKLGAMVSAVPVVPSSSLIIESNESLKTLERALSKCNPKIVQFNHEVSIEDLLVYKKTYEVWQKIDSIEDVKKYKDHADAFVMEYDKVKELSNLSGMSDKKIIVKASSEEQIRDICQKQDYTVDMAYNNNFYQISAKDCYNIFA